MARSICEDHKRKARRNSRGDATREEKELVIIPKTAKKIREEFERRLSHLQESCNHEKSRWTRIDRMPGQGPGQTLVCQRCEKILEAKNPKRGTMRGQAETLGGRRTWSRQSLGGARVKSAARVNNRLSDFDFRPA